MIRSKRIDEPEIWREQFGAHRDFPDVSRSPTIRYVIASTPRSGSHYLGQMMAATGLLGDPLEYFNPANRRRWEQTARVSGEEVQQHIERRRTSPNGCFGMKLHPSHVRSAIAELGHAQLFAHHSFIFIRRVDVLGQAISYSIAQQTGAWVSAVAPRIQPQYDARRISRNIAEICLHNAQWQALLSTYGQRHIAITYEQIRSDPGHALSVIGRFLGVPSDESGDSVRPGTSRQGDERNELWRARYLADMARRSGAPVVDAILNTGGREAAGTSRRAIKLARRAVRTVLS